MLGSNRASRFLGRGAAVCAAVILTAHSAQAQEISGRTTEPADAPGLDYRPGAFVAPRARGADSDVPIVSPGEEGFSAVWSNAEVAVVVNGLVGEFLGLDYVISPGVSGAVTLRVDNIRTRREALGALRAAVSPLGIAIIEDGDFITVAQAAAGGQIAGDISVIAPGESAPLGARAVIIAPRNIAPSEAARLIEPLAPGASVAMADDVRRVLLVSGDTSVLNAASEAVALLDVDWFTQVSTGVFPLSHVSAEQLAGELRSVMGPGALGAEIVPVPRLSTIIVLAQAPQALQAASEWIRRLDVPPVRTVTSGMLIYEARYANAVSLAASIQRIMGGQTGAPEPVETAQPASFAGQTSPTSFNQAGGAPTLGGTSSAFGGSRLPASSSTLAEQNQSTEVNNGLVVTSYTDQNLVVARGGDTQIAEVQALLVALDRPRAQVLIEAAIVEVGLTDDLRYGLNWSGLIDDRLSITLSDSSNGGIASQFPGFSAAYFNADIDAVLNALSSVTRVEVVSRPSVIALHNETALLQIGDQVPITTQSAVSVIDPAAPIVNQTTYRDTGVILSVRPQVLAGGVVEVLIMQEVSDVARTTTSDIDSPTISQRKIESTLLVPSGEAVALGGLIATSRSSGRSGVPILKDAPLLGSLFSSTSNALERTELVVFLTPTILRDPSEAVDVTVRMRAALRRLEGELTAYDP